MMENYLQDWTNPQSQTLEQNPTLPTTLLGPINTRGRQRLQLFKENVWHKFNVWVSLC